MTARAPQRLSRRELARAAFSPYTVVLVVLLGGLAVVGSLASLHDGGGERLVGYLPIVAPAVIAAWASFELLLRRSETPLSIRLFIACIITPLPSALISALAWGAAGLSPYGQESSPPSPWAGTTTTGGPAMPAGWAPWS